MHKCFLRLVLLSVLFGGLVHAAPRKVVSVMTYNVENLFDTKHDEGKEDWTYLPLSFKKSSKEVQSYCQSLTNEYYRRDCLEIDWSDAMLTKKVHQIARVIKSVQNGRAPDILVVQEVENIHALRALNTIGGLGYSEVILVEGKDVRGIDVGILSRYPLAKPAVYHDIDFSRDPMPNNRTAPITRGILEATFRVGPHTVTVLGNHWPSQGNPSEARYAAARTMNEIASRAAKGLVVALGDFNTVHTDRPHGLNEITTNAQQETSFIDAETMKRKLFPKMPLNKGTHNYKGEWSSLDRIFVKRGTVSETGQGGRIPSRLPVARWDSLLIVNPEFAMKPIGNGSNELIPARFDYNTGTGFADHLPVVIAFEL